MTLNTTQQKLQKIILETTQEDRIWMHGFLSGLLNVATPSYQSKNALVSSLKLSVLYGTETGNAKKIAQNFVAVAKQKGINTKTINLSQYNRLQLEKEENIVLIISTQGEGEPPVEAKEFYDFIHQEKLNLSAINFSVLALGDSSYPMFCKVGEDVFQQFVKHQAKPILDLQKCDLDFEETTNAWITETLNLFLKDKNTILETPTIVVEKISKPFKTNYSGLIQQNINLNDIGSNKQTHHIEFVAEGIDYEPGDALGIIPVNENKIVEEILSITKIDGDKNFTHKNQTNSIRNLLKSYFNISYLLPISIEAYQKNIDKKIEEKRIDLLSLLKKYPLKTPSEYEVFLNHLTAMPPRLYSISSSNKTNENEVHITVALDNFIVDEQIKYGLCSKFLSNQKINSSHNIFVQRNNHFRLPNENVDIIMIGPGTGIAPFRSFLSERSSLGSSGRNWLFFGEQQSYADFLYQAEIQAWVQEGVLTKTSLAFSRDQKEKIYVQHLMQQEAKIFFEWVEKGAVIYVCGKRDPMSKDVEKMLLEIIKSQTNFSDEKANDYLENLKNNHRYLKDVY